MTFAKARQRVASGGNSTSNGEMANETVSQATSLLEDSEAEVVEVDGRPAQPAFATLANLSTLQTAVNLSWYGDMMREPAYSNDWRPWSWGPNPLDPRMNQQQFQQYVIDNDWGTAITMPRDFTAMRVECDIPALEWWVNHGGTKKYNGYGHLAREPPRQALEDYVGDHDIIIRDTSPFTEAKVELSTSRSARSDPSSSMCCL